MKKSVSLFVFILFVIGMTQAQNGNNPAKPAVKKDKVEKKQSDEQELAQKEAESNRRSSALTDSRLVVEGGNNLFTEYEGDITGFHSGSRGNVFYGESNASGLPGGAGMYARSMMSGYNTTPLGSINTGVWGNATGNGSGGYGALATYGPDLAAPITYAALAGASYAGLFMGGNVGIGTNAPAYQLVVHGETNIAENQGQITGYHGSNFGNAIYAESNSLGTASGTNPYAVAHIAGINSNSPFGTQNAGLWGIATGEGSGGWGVMASHGDYGSEDTYVGLASEMHAGAFMGGNVGIGTIAPAAPLHIDGTNEALRIDGTNRWISWYDGGTYKGYLYHTGNNMTLSNQLAGYLRFRTNSAIRMTIDAAGEVGIGTTNPEAQLHIAAGGDASLTNDGYLMTGSKTGLNIIHDNNEIMARNNGAASDLFLQNDAGNLRVANANAGGKLSVGNVTPATEIHVVHASGFGSHGITIQSTVANAGHWTLYADASAANDRLYFLPDGSSSPDAHVEKGSGNWVPTSDRRLKKNIESISNVMPSIMQLNPTKYHMNEQQDSEEKTFGLIAQEAKDVFPGIVNYIEEVDQYGLSYTELIPIIIAGMQEQQANIQNYEAENKMLREELMQMKAEFKAIKEALKE